MAGPIDGMHYDQELRRYVPDVVSETVNPFTLLSKPSQVVLSDLPLSPRKAFKAALECGWEARAWVSTGEVAPTLYLTASEEPGKEHNVGDERFPGYAATLFTIEARNPKMPLGFRAQYVGKQYADRRKASAGAFDGAKVLDPIGIPRALYAVYEPITQLRGKDETSASFQRRVEAATAMAVSQRKDYNDGASASVSVHQFTDATDFTTWLSEWKSFATPIKKVTT